MEHTAEVLVVGEGPLAWITALAHAHAGRRVRVLMDAIEPRAEEVWLYPAAVEALDRLGVDLATRVGDAVSVRGICIDGPHVDAPALLTHSGRPGTMLGVHALNRSVRETALAHPAIRAARVPGGIRIDDQRVRFGGEYGGVLSIRADRIVLAHRDAEVIGNLGVVGQEAGEPVTAVTVDLRGGTLPEDGYVHVRPGPAGPLVIRRVAPDRIRLRMYVPSDWKDKRDGPNLLWAAHGPLIPASLRSSVRDALAGGAARWDVRWTQPREAWGRSGLARIGTACGVAHPAFGIDMSLGILDACALAASADEYTFAREARERSATAEFLASSLPSVLCSSNGSSVVRALRSRPEAAPRVLEALGGELSGLAALDGAGLGVLTVSALQSVRRPARGLGLALGGASFCQPSHGPSSRPRAFGTSPLASRGHRV